MMIQFLIAWRLTEEVSISTGHEWHRVAACGGRSFVTKDGMKSDETQKTHLRSFDMDVVTTR